MGNIFAFGLIQLRLFGRWPALGHSGDLNHRVSDAAVTSDDQRRILLGIAADFFILAHRQFAWSMSSLENDSSSDRAAALGRGGAGWRRRRSFRGRALLWGWPLLVFRAAGNQAEQNRDRCEHCACFHPCLP